MSLDKDIEELSNDPSTSLMEMKDSGRIELITLSEIMTPQYPTCDICSFNKTCPMVQLDEFNKPMQVECVLEKKMVKGLMIRLQDHGVNTSDEPLIYPLIHEFLRMRRFYAIETFDDFITIMNNPEMLDLYRKRFIMLNKTVSQYLKILKELLATRKEYESQRVKVIEEYPDDFSIMLSEDDVEDADEKE